MAIQLNDNQQIKVDTKGLLDNGKIGNKDEAMIEFLENNSALVKEVKYLKIEQEIKSIALCEAIEQRKKAMANKLMVEEDKRQIASRLEETSFQVHKLTNNQLDMINQKVIANQEANGKDVVITNLKLQNEQLKNE